MKILFIASVSVVAADPVESRKLFVGALGLPLEHAEDDDYYCSEKIAGSRHFGVWPLSQAAKACCGTDHWPGDRPTPQFSIEFEVEDAVSVDSAARELEAKGYSLLHSPRTEPWGQTVARIQTTEGTIVGISYAPWLHQTGQR